jgi:signal transduction histidine kinase
VVDNGIGMSEDDQQHLFERFFRGANVTNIQGTGLGLHIVSKYVELMNGQIQCSSVLEEGTTFTITFTSN